MKTSNLLRLILVLIGSMLSLIAEGQKENNIWYFGFKAGLDFNYGSPPKILTDGQLSTLEGCASISDKTGKLLFYTDGVFVWDRLHRTMPNGKGTLTGNSTTTQSALIVPNPANTNLYYVFALSPTGTPGGLKYSMLDMRLNNGYGDIISSSMNQTLQAPCAEKLTAVSNADNTGYWVLAHGYNDNKYYAWQITKSGISSNPVITAVGSTHGISSGAIGYMKFNQTGNRLAVCIPLSNIVEILNFDRSTGSVSNPVTINGFDYPYGCEFSPNGRFLYVGEVNEKQVTQFDLNSSSIPNSRYVVATEPAPVGALQLGQDNIIYISILTRYLSTITLPDNLHTGCNYQYSSVNMMNVGYGLPNIIPNSFFVKCNKPDLGPDTTLCPGEKLILHATFPKATYLWQDGSSDSIFTVKTAGTYTVRRTVGACTTADTINVSYSDNPSFSLGKDTTLCPGESYYLHIAYPKALYLWQDGSTDGSHLVDKAGTYSVQRIVGKCLATDTINVYYRPNTLFSFGRKDTTLCKGETWTYVVGDKRGQVVQWQDGSKGESYSTTKDEKVWLVMSAERCIYSDTINVHFIDKPSFSLGRDTILCPGEKLLLQVPSAYKVKWQDGTVSNTYVVLKAGTYIAAASNPCGTTTVGIRVAYYQPQQPYLGSDSFICLGKSIWLYAGDSNSLYKYLWNTGSKSNSLLVRDSGQYIVQKTGPCGIMTDTIRLNVEDCSCPVFTPYVFTPNADKINDTWQPVMCPTTQYTLSIYNRWGELVFHTSHQNEGWDGKSKGEYVPEGVYYYQLFAKTKYGEHKYFAGMVTLLR